MTPEFAKKLPVMLKILKRSGLDIIQTGMNIYYNSICTPAETVMNVVVEEEDSSTVVSPS